MAKILHSAYAPTGKLTYRLGQSGFELEGDGVYETNDRALLASADEHPWLKVEYERSPILEDHSVDPHVPYKDDVLAAVNSHAFDVQAAEQLIVEAVEIRPVAIDADLKQTKNKHVGEVAVTISAAEADVDKAEKAIKEHKN